MAKYVKPTLDTRFHIDFAWWEKSGKNLRNFLKGHACPEAMSLYEENGKDQTFDWISPETGKIYQVDLLWHYVHVHCSQEPDFITNLTPLTTAIFRAFIANNNTPMTPYEIHAQIQKKSPNLILRTVGGHKVYNGIRPAVNAI